MVGTVELQGTTNDYRPNGFSLGTTLSNIGDDKCIQQMAFTTTSTSYSNGDYTKTYPVSIRVHTPYKVMYEEEDRNTMKPKPPDVITCTLTVPTWVPGTKVNVKKLCADTEEHGSAGDAALMGFLSIGLPIILGGGMLCCCGSCFYYSQKNKDEARRSARRRQTAEEAATAAAVAAVAAAEQAEAAETVETERNDEPPPVYSRRE
ncbi:hypothetical protein Sste5344_004607 [Sporothrix stenoceras]